MSWLPVTAPQTQKTRDSDGTYCTVFRQAPDGLPPAQGGSTKAWEEGLKAKLCPGMPNHPTKPLSLLWG